MKGRAVGKNGRIVSFIDIGTNSVRLLVVRINPDHSYSTLTRQKQQIRLGEGEFGSGEILPEAIERLVVVTRTFSELAATFGTEEFVAVGTSALREAANQHAVLQRLRQEARLDVRVITGEEEARLIYLGVSGGLSLGDQPAFFVDIGGGSTEVAVGDEGNYRYLESFRLGAVRLANLCLQGTGPVSRGRYRRVQHAVKEAITASLPKIRREKPVLAIGSSGTIINLAEIAARTCRGGPARGDEGHLTYRDLRKVTELLCSLPLAERRKVPGINPERADIIIGGAAILDVFMKVLSLDTITVSSRGLQDGLLADYLSRMDAFPLLRDLSPRERSVLQLGRSCGINEVHARTVTGLVLELFDSARDLGLHTFGAAERELLEYATFLHDVGSFISYTNHQDHSWYIIMNSELPHFSHEEIAFMANLARFHRKRSMRKREPSIPDLNGEAQRRLRILATFVRLGESLDRSHTALVRHVRFSSMDEKCIHLEVAARGDCQLEIWGVESEKKVFVKVFGRELCLVRIPCRG